VTTVQTERTPLDVGTLTGTPSDQVVASAEGKKLLYVTRLAAPSRVVPAAPTLAATSRPESGAPKSPGVTTPKIGSPMAMLLLAAADHPDLVDTAGNKFFQVKLSRAGGLLFLPYDGSRVRADLTLRVKVPGAASASNRNGDSVTITGVEASSGKTTLLGTFMNSEGDLMSSELVLTKPTTAKVH
ncbi:MAG: hypothetical protein KGR26_14990, partial [Cyanobacteria bacterium REEB65]|nr:hypothetical protein [Cyanobacteria bacterium REEB65]